MCFMNDWFVVWRRDGSVAVWAPRVVQRVRSPQDLSAVLGSSPPSSGTEDCGFCGRVSRGAVHALVTVPASRTNPCEWAWQVEAVALLSPPLEESNGPRKIWSQLVEGYYLRYPLVGSSSHSGAPTPGSTGVPDVFSRWPTSAGVGPWLVASPLGSGRKCRSPRGRVVGWRAGTWRRSSHPRADPQPSCRNRKTYGSSSTCYCCTQCQACHYLVKNASLPLTTDDMRPGGFRVPCPGWKTAGDDYTQCWRASWEGALWPVCAWSAGGRLRDEAHASPSRSLSPG